MSNKTLLTLSKNMLYNVNIVDAMAVLSPVKTGAKIHLLYEITRTTHMNDLISRLETLKSERDAVVLAHYYVDGSVQDAADYVGDSYYLSTIAKNSPHQTILFCGVKFMAESAKILSPEKTVVMPDTMADCPMAHMVSPEYVNNIRESYSDLTVVCYINSTTEIKAVSDVCVTSSNAKKIISATSTKNILFIPDRNLGSYLQGFFPEKNFILPKGCCPVHSDLTTEDLLSIKQNDPETLVLTHPECEPEIVGLSDFVGSTSEIIDFPAHSKAKNYIIYTEHGVAHILKQKYPDKTFLFPSPIPVCKDMKLITLEKAVRSLETMASPIEVPESLRKAAQQALIRMHELAG